MWVGITGVTAPPVIEVRLDGAVIPNPTFVRPFTSVRSGDMLQPNEPRAFTAILDLPAPGRVDVTFGGVTRSINVRAMPRDVPPWGFAQPLRIMLASCFDRRTDKNVAGRLVKALADKQPPDLSIFLGDQVYLDLPTFQDLGHATRDMAVEFEKKYVANWFPDQTGYDELLRTAPAVFSPDDHEYWNNFPHAAAHIENTWNGTIRERWERSSVAMWNAFQLHAGRSTGDAVRLDFPQPLSILVLDTRSARRPDYTHLMSDTAADAVRDWANFVIDKSRIGVLVTGQSIFEKPAGGLGKRFGDARLANHDDYVVIVTALSRLVANRRPVLCLTGDVHWGRVLTLENTPLANRLYEVISSPVALVENVVSNVFQPIKNIFIDEGPWPKHSEPPSKPFTLDDFGGNFDFRTKKTQRGNHVVMLTMGTVGPTTVRVKASFHPLHRSKPNTPVEFEFDLR